MELLGIVGSLASILSFTVPIISYYVDRFWVHLSRNYRSVSTRPHYHFQRYEVSSRVRFNILIFSYEKETTRIDERAKATITGEEKLTAIRETFVTNRRETDSGFVVNSHPAMPETSVNCETVFKSERLPIVRNEDESETQREDRNGLEPNK